MENLRKPTPSLARIWIISHEGPGCSFAWVLWVVSVLYSNALLSIKLIHVLTVLPPGPFFTWSHHCRLTGCEAQQTSKGVYKAALFYVEQTVTLHIVLFSVWAQLFLQYWIVVHMDLNTLCVLCRVRASEQKKSRTKTCNKETGRFHKQLTLLPNWVHIRCIYGSVVEGPSQISYNILILVSSSHVLVLLSEELMNHGNQSTVLLRYMKEILACRNEFLKRHKVTSSVCSDEGI